MLLLLIVGFLTRTSTAYENNHALIKLIEFYHAGSEKRLLVALYDIIVFLLQVLDKMVKGEGGKYLAPKYLPDDIYEPYNNFKPPNLVYRPFH